MLALAAWQLLSGKNTAPHTPPEPLTLAVMPFDSLGTAQEDGALALGLAREIRNTLSRVRGLRVISDASSFAAAQENTGAVEIAKRLDADLLLDGSFTREGETVNLTAELVEAWNGTNIWTGRYSGPAADIDRVRRDLAAAAYEQIVKRVGPNRLEMLAPPKTTDPRAYQKLIEARELLENTVRMRMRGRGRDETVLAAGERAHQLVEEALVIEPESPLGLRMRAQIISMEATRDLLARNLSTAEKQALAAVELRRALASDPDSSAALAALGEYYRRFEWRWQDSEALLTRALALDPNNAEAHLSYAYYLSGVGRCVEALEHARLAIALDPQFGWRTLGVPRALKCLGRFEESDAAYLTALAHDPGSMFILRELYLNKLMRGDPKAMEALRTHVRETLWRGQPNEDVQGWLTWTGFAVDAMNGDKERFLEVVQRDIDAMEGQGETIGPPEKGRFKGDLMWIQAVELAFVGETQRAITQLEGAVAASTLYIPETMPYGAEEFTPEMRADPRYKAIWNSDPRLVELLKMRETSVKARQMKGVLNGKVVSPVGAD